MPLPGNKIVTYKSRETPSNETSTVLIERRLFIAAQSQNGDDITWKINMLKFHQPGGGDWINNSPGLGWWVVTHADPASPVASDFKSPLSMSGTATTDDYSGDDLTYSTTAGTCDLSESQMYGGDVSGSAYSFSEASTTIAEEEEDEPEETEIIEDPS